MNNTFFSSKEDYIKRPSSFPRTSEKAHKSARPSSQPTLLSDLDERGEAVADGVEDCAVAVREKPNDFLEKHGHLRTRQPPRPGATDSGFRLKRGEGASEAQNVRIKPKRRKKQKRQ